MALHGPPKLDPGGVGLEAGFRPRGGGLPGGGEGGPGLVVAPEIRLEQGQRLGRGQGSINGAEGGVARHGLLEIGQGLVEPAGEPAQVASGVPRVPGAQGQIGLEGVEAGPDRLDERLGEGVAVVVEGHVGGGEAAPDRLRHQAGLVGGGGASTPRLQGVIEAALAGGGPGLGQRGPQPLGERIQGGVAAGVGHPAHRPAALRPVGPGEGEAAHARRRHVGRQRQAAQGRLIGAPRRGDAGPEAHGVALSDLHEGPPRSRRRRISPQGEGVAGHQPEGDAIRALGHGEGIDRLSVEGLGRRGLAAACAQGAEQGQRQQRRRQREGAQTATPASAQ